MMPKIEIRFCFAQPCFPILLEHNRCRVASIVNIVNTKHPFTFPPFFAVWFWGEGCG